MNSSFQFLYHKVTRECGIYISYTINKVVYIFGNREHKIACRDSFPVFSIPPAGVGMYCTLSRGAREFCGAFSLTPTITYVADRDSFRYDYMAFPLVADGMSGWMTKIASNL